MSFRRNSEPTRRWKEWRTKHAIEVAACGLPDAVYRDARSWENFLFDGFLPDEGMWNGWNVTMLSMEQTRRFLDFLSRECVDELGARSMIHQLFKRLKEEEA